MTPLKTFAEPLDAAVAAQDHQTVFAIVASEMKVVAILEELGMEGFSNREISALLPAHPTAPAIRNSACDAPSAAVATAGHGGPATPPLGALVGIGSIHIPDDGFLIASGPVLEDLTAESGETFERRLSTALIDIGIEEWDARKLAESVIEGAILISVQTTGAAQRDKATEVLENEGAFGISVSGPKA